jgi:hypothetical protein
MGELRRIGIKDKRRSRLCRCEGTIFISSMFSSVPFSSCTRSGKFGQCTVSVIVEKLSEIDGKMIRACRCSWSNRALALI